MARLLIVDDESTLMDALCRTLEQEGYSTAGFTVASDLRVENGALQRRLRERTTELEATNRELEAFGYSVSHDLRAPLRTIVGFSQILLEDYASQIPEEAQRPLNNVASGAQRMGKLIEDLLHFSRLGRQAISCVPVRMADLVREIVGELQLEQPERQINVAIGELPDVNADPALLRQVMVNLLSNAVKFTRHKPDARIEVRCEKSAEGEDVYVVRDNGADFDMRYASRLFGVFQRFHHAEEFEGTGVGLSVAQRIIRRHGGKIWADAKVDHGATFCFTLPDDAERSNSPRR